MATTVLTRNKTLPDSSTKADFHELIDTTTAETTDIANADIVAGAAIVDTKLAQITTAGKVSGAALTSLTSIPSGAGVIPDANVDGATKDDATNNAVSDIFTVEHTTTGNPATGIGTGIVIKVEDAGGSEEQASIDVALTDVTDAQEDADIIFKQNINGTMTETARLDADGGLTIAIAAASTPVANTIVKDNIIKGWIQFNGTGTISTDDSYNVTSITDNGTGDYTVTWNTDFANAYYSTGIDVVATVGQRLVHGYAKAAGTYQIICLNPADGTPVDATGICVIAIGDQT